MMPWCYILMLMIAMMLDRDSDDDHDFWALDLEQRKGGWADSIVNSTAHKIALLWSEYSLLYASSNITLLKINRIRERPRKAKSGSHDPLTGDDFWSQAGNLSTKGKVKRRCTGATFPGQASVVQRQQRKYSQSIFELKEAQTWRRGTKFPTSIREMGQGRFGTNRRHLCPAWIPPHIPK